MTAKILFRFMAAMAATLSAVTFSCSKGPATTEDVFSVSPQSITADSSGGEQILRIQSSGAWTITAPEWITCGVTSGKGSSSAVQVRLNIQANKSEARTGDIVVAGESATQKVPVTQSEYTKPKTLKVLVCGNSMIYYGGLVQQGGQKKEDTGMLYKMLSSTGMDVKVFDCTYGGHHLCDFSAAGCRYTDAHGTDGKKASSGCTGIGNDLLGNLNLSEMDWIVISEAGNNYDHFYSDAVTLFNRVKSVNPSARLVYINHIYSVFKKHTNVLGSLKTLHDNQGVTIVNCGQLGYDIYTRAVKVPGGTLNYSDKYTFVNHTSSDSHHPNPLMGYMMTQMLCCAITGEKAEGVDYMSFVKGCSYAGGGVSYNSYYSSYYTTPAALPYMDVFGSSTEMKGIQKLIPEYIDKY